MATPNDHPPAFRLVDVLIRHAPVLESLLDILDIQDVISLSRTCKDLSELYQILTRTRFNIDKALKIFFDDPIAFRSIQAETNTLIVGRWVYDFLIRKRALSYQISLMVKQGDDANILQEFLEGAGYTCTDKSDKGGNYKKTVGRRSRQVAVKVTPHFSLWKLISQTRITCSFNFITWEKAYSVFPRATFCLRKGYLLNPYNPTRMEPQWNEYFQSWKNMGLSIEHMHMSDTVGGLSLEKSPISFQPRRFADGMSWVIPLRTEGVQPSLFPSYAVDYSSFHMEKSSALSPGPDSYHMICNLVEWNSLRYQYIWDSYQKSESPMIAGVSEHFRSLAAYQMSQIAEDLRLPNFPTNWRNYSDDFLSKWEHATKPVDWKYHDDKFLEILKARYPELPLAFPPVTLPRPFCAVQ